MRNSSTWWRTSLRQIKEMPPHLRPKPWRERTKLRVMGCSLMNCLNHEKTLKRMKPWRRQQRSEIIHCLDYNCYCKLVICIMINCTYSKTQYIMLAIKSLKIKKVLWMPLFGYKYLSTKTIIFQLQFNAV